MGAAPDLPVYRILSDNGLINARERHIARLQEIYEGKKPARPFFLFGITGNINGVAPPAQSNPLAGIAQSTSLAPVDPYVDAESWVAKALEDLAQRADALRDETVFRPLCLEFGPYGVHFIDRILGAHVYTSPDGTWWVDYLSGEVGALRAPDLFAHDTWSLARRFAMAFLGAGVTVPFFGLPTIASALNIALNLYGETILLAFYEEPDAARRGLRIINRVLCETHRWYLANIPHAQLQPVIAQNRCQPPGHGQLCGCSTQLVSRHVYQEFIAPLDEELISVYPNGGMIHLCGSHTQHIPVWRAMKRMRAFQLNDRAAEDFEQYYRELGDDRIFYINPTENVTIERILKVTDGRRVVIIADP